MCEELPDEKGGDKQARERVEFESVATSQVATKSDNAPVDVLEWDIWTNNYEPPESNCTQRVLICKPGPTIQGCMGSYSMHYKSFSYVRLDKTH